VCDKFYVFQPMSIFKDITFYYLAISMQLCITGKGFLKICKYVEGFYDVWRVVTMYLIDRLFAGCSLRWLLSYSSVTTANTGLFLHCWVYQWHRDWWGNSYWMCHWGNWFLLFWLICNHFFIKVFFTVTSFCRVKYCRSSLCMNLWLIIQCNLVLTNSLQ